MRDGNFRISPGSFDATSTGERATIVPKISNSGEDRVFGEAGVLAAPMLFVTDTVESTSLDKRNRNGRVSGQRPSNDQATTTVLEERKLISGNHRKFLVRGFD